MSNYRHTAGPWNIKTHTSRFDPEVVIDDGVCGPDGEQIRVHGVTITSSEEAKANAWLFAASPDMLAALQEVLKAPGLKSGLQALCAAAVAKATGRSIEDVITGSSHERSADE